MLAHTTNPRGILMVNLSMVMANVRKANGHEKIH